MGAGPEPVAVRCEGRSEGGVGDGRGWGGKMVAGRRRVGRGLARGSVREAGAGPGRGRSLVVKEGGAGDGRGGSWFCAGDGLGWGPKTVVGWGRGR